MKNNGLPFMSDSYTEKSLGNRMVPDLYPKYSCRLATEANFIKLFSA
jgi:hypothetical protein